MDKQAGRLNMTHLGLMKNDYDRLTQLVHRPHGIILVTGPTGSKPRPCMRHCLI